MQEIDRIKRKQGKLSDKAFFRKGDVRQCRVCGFYYGEGTGDISKIERGWVCFACEDPDK